MTYIHTRVYCSNIGSLRRYFNIDNLILDLKSLLSIVLNFCAPISLRKHKNQVSTSIAKLHAIGRHDCLPCFMTNIKYMNGLTIWRTSLLKIIPRIFNINLYTWTIKYLVVSKKVMSISSFSTFTFLFSFWLICYSPDDGLCSSESSSSLIASRSFLFLVLCVFDSFPEDWISPSTLSI